MSAGFLLSGDCLTVNAVNGFLMVFRFLAAYLLILLAITPAWAKPLTVAAVLDPAGMMKARISPDGSKVAAVIYNGTNHGLVLIDSKTREAKGLYWGRRDHVGFYHYTKAPREIMWVGNDLLVANFGLVAAVMDMNGKIVREIGESYIGLAERDNPSSGKVIVYTDEEDDEIAVVDVRTGKRRDLTYPKGKPIHWAFDRNGELRAVTVTNSPFWKDVVTVTQWYRPSAQGEWVKLEEHPLADERWSPLYVPDQPDRLVIRSRVGRDTFAVFEYDTAQRKQVDMLAGHPTQDILSVGGIDQAAFEYVSTSGMVTQQVWFNPKWAAMQRTIDAALPNRINRISGEPDKMVLVHSYSDTDPGTYYLLDVEQKTMSALGRFKPALDGADMLATKVIGYRSFDGLEIPAYLTRPAGGEGPAPMVVLVHGGPAVRDYWGWSDEVQILAAHGYAVFQPQFRGSAGFGKKFEESGYRQWGRSMQADITAGVQQLIKDGIADPARICIVGWSYGGYAALWGLVQTPDLYRCGVSAAGVVDIANLMTDSSDTNDTKAGRLLMVKLIGDKNADGAMFDAVSPLKEAHRIKAPVMLVHGEEDRRVLFSHAKKMKAALEGQGKSVEWLTFDNEGHGLRYVVNEWKYYETLLNFLRKHIGGAAPRMVDPEPEAKP